MGIYRRLESPLDITTSTIIRRIVANHEAYQVITVIRWLWVLSMQYAACCTVHIYSYITRVSRFCRLHINDVHMGAIVC